MDQNIHEIYLKAMSLFEKEDYEGAERLLLRITQQNPLFADIHNKLGIIYHQKGALGRASKAFEKALRLNPNYTEASLNLAITYNDLGKYDEATKIFNKAANIAYPSPNTLDPYIKGRLANQHAELGNVYYDLGFYNEAIDQYKTALKLGPNFSDIRIKLGIAYRDKGKYDKAAKEFLTALEKTPHYIPASINLGITYYIQGRKKLAVSEWEKVLEKKPDDQTVLMYLNFIKNKKS